MPPQAVKKRKVIRSAATEHDRMTKGQQIVNLIWENTQARIALFVIVVGMVINSIVIILMIILIREVTVVQVALISLCLQFINFTSGIVIGFYFSRTNHQAIGGIGRKPRQKYTGR
jgi:hypothetical protein